MSLTVESATPHVISLAPFVLAYFRGWAANCPNARIRLADNEHLKKKVALRNEQARIKDGRMALIQPHQQPHYPPIKRFAILGLKAEGEAFNPIVVTMNRNIALILQVKHNAR